MKANGFNGLLILLVVMVLVIGCSKVNSPQQDNPEVLARKAFIVELTNNSEVKWVEYTLVNKTIDIRAVPPS